MTELGDVPRLPGRALSRFYALKEMTVMGSCLCHGHANRCLQEQYNNLLPNGIQVGEKDILFIASTVPQSGRTSGKTL